MVRTLTVGSALAAVGAACVLGVFVAAALASSGRDPAAQGRPAVALAQLERGVLADINAYRRQNHLHPLRLSSQLTLAARQHSDEMAQDGYFGHDSVSGGSFWRRVEHYYSPASRRHWAVGENLLWSSPSVSAGRALQLWIGSPEHKRILLTAGWREIGISAVHAAHAPGVYHGLAVTIVTADFGVRR